MFRSDVKKYYASIDPSILLGLLRQQVADQRVLNLLSGYVKRTLYEDGML